MRATATISAAAAEASWRVPLRAWAASRALVLAAALVAGLLFGVPERGVEAEVPRALAMLGGWDTTWYLEIARDGYARDIGQVGAQFTDLAFFPLVPAVMAGAAAAGLNPFLATLVVSNLAFLGALWGLYALTRRRLGPTAASRATWVLALAPPAIAASQAYTEGLALALAVGAGLLACRGRWELAGLAAAGAALTRPTGAAVMVLVVLLAWRGPAPGRPRRLALAAVPTVAALGAFLGWMQVARGAWDLPLRAQGAWDRGGPGVGLVTHGPEEVSSALRKVADLDFTAAWTATGRDVAFGALYVALLVVLWRREGGLRSPWVAYSALVLAAPLSSGSVSSLARFGLMAFPLAWPAAEWLEARPRRVVWAAGAAVVVTLLLVAQLDIRSP